MKKSFTLHNVIKFKFFLYITYSMYHTGFPSYLSVLLLSLSPLFYTLSVLPITSSWNPLHFLYLAPSLYSFCATLLRSCSFSTKSSPALLINSLQCVSSFSLQQLRVPVYMQAIPSNSCSGTIYHRAPQKGLMLCCTFNNQYCSLPGKPLLSRCNPSRQ